MAGADRAINMALRVQGIGDVERDFKRAGDAGEKSFSRVAKSANGAAREVSDYHARLKRVAAQARADAANMPDLNKGPALDSARARNRFVLDRVDAEKSRIRSGLPDMTLPGADDGARKAGLLTSALRGVGGAAGVAGIGLAALGGLVVSSTKDFLEHERAVDRFNATLSLSGNASNAQAAAIEAMAGRVSDATLQTEDSALRAAATLARVPGITSEVLEQAIDASARFADAVEGDVAEQAEKTGAVLSALAKGDLKALVNAIDGLSVPLQTMILDLAEAGKTAEAQQVYLKALTAAAGNGPDGLTTATDSAGEAWKRLKASIASMTSGPAESVLNAIAASLDFVRERADLAAAALKFVLTRQVNVEIGGGGRPPGPSLINGIAGRALDLYGTASGRSPLGMATLAIGGAGGGSVADAKALEERRNAILNPDKPKKGRSGGRGEGDRLAREAEQARNAADRVAESNDDIVESYRLRAQQASEMLGLEGAALEAVERRHEIDAVVNRLSRDEIEKTMEARRAEAAAAGKAFDEAKALAETTAALDAKSAALRRYAEDQYDAAKAQEDFLKQEERAQAIYEATRTPEERIKRDLASATDALRNGTIDSDTYARRVRQLAEAWVDAGGRIRNVWTGLGDEISASLGEIIVRGGSAKDILRDVVESIALRTFDNAVGNPLADWIDGLTGNNREKNVGKAEGELLQSAGMAAGSVGTLGVNADLAAGSLGRIAGVGAPLDSLTGDIDSTSRALRDCMPDIGRFGAGLGGLFDILSRGTGGGGGLFGSILNAGLSLFGGGSRAGITNGGAAIKAAGKTSIRGFAGGGEPPIGVPFSVGENGMEYMYLTPGGGARVLSGEQSRRMGRVDNPTININVSGARGNAEIRDMVSEGVRTGLSEYNRGVGEHVTDNLARRGD